MLPPLSDLLPFFRYLPPLYTISTHLFLSSWCEYPLVNVKYLSVPFLPLLLHHLVNPLTPFFSLLLNLILPLTCCYLHYQTNILGKKPVIKCIPPSPSNPYYLVTGGNSGIGLQTCHLLLTAGHNVICLSRSKDRGLAALKTLNLSTSSNTVGNYLVESCDLSSFTSVKACVSNLKKYDITCLILNAGCMMPTQKIVSNNLDCMMSSNYYGHYLLTRLLLSSGKNIKKIVSVTSSTHWYCKKLNVENLECEKGGYTLFGQYGKTKLCNILFSETLRKKYPTIKTYSVHPGIVRTNVVRNLPPLIQFLNSLAYIIMVLIQKPAVYGAYGEVYCALEEVEEGYYANCLRREWSGVGDGEELWRVTEVKVGLI